MEYSEFKVGQILVYEPYNEEKSYVCVENIRRKTIRVITINTETPKKFIFLQDGFWCGFHTLRHITSEEKLELL
jgi:hypothetical protein